MKPPGNRGFDRVPLRMRSPVITPKTHPSVGININGPTVITVPDWVEGSLGRYYMYFASHTGDTIRMAFSNGVEGPWQIHPPGALHLSDTGFIDHIASPDVHVDDRRQEIRMYFHGLVEREGWKQGTRLAVSPDGLDFDVGEELLGAPYFRAFRWNDMWYALAMPGIFYRSADGISQFIEGPQLFGDSMRHSAVTRDGDVLTVFYTNAGDCPEAILTCQIDLGADWTSWRPSKSRVLLEPEVPYEGGNLELRPSERGAAERPVRQLRDPFVFREGECAWLFYAIAGEQGIAVARLVPREESS